MSATDRARALLAEATSRGAIKRLAESVGPGDRELRQALVDEGRARGAEIPDEAVDWPAKRLIRLALAREARAQELHSPIRRDEAFVCAHCAFEVPPHGRTARNHCPRCLRSLHVDVVPGDRAADCGGVMDPVGLEVRGGELVLRHRCRRCGAERPNRALTDGAVPDDARALALVSRGELP